jgi:hypothetical protein
MGLVTGGEFSGRYIRKVGGKLSPGPTCRVIYGSDTETGRMEMSFDDPAIWHTPKNVEIGDSRSAPVTPLRIGFRDDPTDKKDVPVRRGQG